LEGDSGQEFRRRVAQDDGLWKQLKETQNRAAFAPLFGLRAGAVDPRVEAAGADFMAIQSWAQAMSGAGQALREVGELLASGPVAAGEARFSQAREILKQRLGKVVQETRDEFGDPLGMVMFYGAAQGKADRQVMLTGEKVETIEMSAKALLAAHA
jgi:hypothetical protein